MMPKRGPPKTPSAVLKARKTFRKDRHTDEIDVAAGSAVPDPPEHLDDRTRAVWLQIGPKLAEFGLLTHLDGIGFELLCQSYVDTLSATEQLKADDLVVFVGENSTPMPNPLVGIISKNLTTLKWCLTQFGLTPAARNGLKSGKGDDKPADPMAELMGG
jgi:P27 family predicted phage terminase small subunit